MRTKERSRLSVVLLSCLVFAIGCPSDGGGADEGSGEGSQRDGEGEEERTGKGPAEGEDKYTLSIEVSGFGTVDLSPPGGAYSAGTTVTLEALPRDNWKLHFWQGDLSGTKNPTSIVMNGNASVTAKFIVSVGVGGGGAGPGRGMVTKTPR